MEPHTFKVGEYELFAFVNEKGKLVLTVRVGGRSVVGPIKISQTGKMKTTQSFGDGGAMTISQQIIVD